MDKKSKSFYLLSEEDAYRIEGLLSTLSMAVWEVLRTCEMTHSPPNDDENPTLAQNMFEEETSRILAPKDDNF